MNNINVKFIELLEVDFENIQSEYINLSHAFNTGNLAVFKRLKSTWDASCEKTASLSRIRRATVNYYENGDFSKEVRNNLFTNHLGAIEFTRVVFAKQDRFIKQQFPEAVLQYFNNVDDCRYLVELMLDERETLSNKEFFQATQFQFIQYFKWLEDQFYWIYPLYKPHLSAYDDIKVPHISKTEHIQLDYIDNEAVIDALYNFLYPTYIEVSFGQFAAHFENNGLFEKMTWKKTQKCLAAFVNGVPYIDRVTRKPSIYRLKIKNSYKNVMSQHFLNRFGKVILPDLAEKSKDSLTGVINEDVDAIKEFLKRINDMEVG